MVVGLLYFDRKGSDFMHLPNYNDARKRDNKDYKRVDFEFDEKIKNKYSGKTFYLKTYGCQMNEHDS